MKIAVNGREVEVAPEPVRDRFMEYSELIVLAGYGSYEDPTVTWRAKDGENGTLCVGEKIWVEHGMNFSIVYTGNA